MKKGSTFLLILLSVGFCTFLLGVFVGRSVRGESPIIEVAVPGITQTTESTTSVVTTESKQLVNINTASAAHLDTLPGIGPVLAERIVAYREKNGPFRKITDIANVEGIGAETMLKILDHITVED